jgi:hypothetical protein
MQSHLREPFAPWPLCTAAVHMPHAQHIEGIYALRFLYMSAVSTLTQHIVERTGSCIVWEYVDM